MTVEIFDACSMLAYIQAEPGGPIIESLLADPSRTCYSHALNLCEVYYQVLRSSDEPTAKLAVDSLLAAGVIVREDMDEAFWKSVGRNKARGRISLADCFCIALAIRLSGRVVTADHGEFDPLVPLGICPIFFFR